MTLLLPTLAFLVGAAAAFALGAWLDRHFRLVRFSPMEAAVLAGDMEHSPNCVFGNGAVPIYVDDDGGTWADHHHTVPWSNVSCSCGYFAHLDNARFKLRATSSERTGR